MALRADFRLGHPATHQLDQYLARQHLTTCVSRETPTLQRDAIRKDWNAWAILRRR